jgi:actin-related protein 6
MATRGMYNSVHQKASIMKLTSSIVSFLSLTAHFTSAELKCRPEGPVLPRPTALTKSPIFQAAANNLTETLNAALSGSITAGWPTNNVSFSLAVVSTDQDDLGVPIWEYHHLAAANTKGTKKLDRDSQYLIGSITKVFTDYVLLKSGMNIDAPVTEYLPGLDGKSEIRWRDVTLRMLASYLGGTPANCRYPPLLKYSMLTSFRWVLGLLSPQRSLPRLRSSRH